MPFRRPSPRQRGAALLLFILLAGLGGGMLLMQAIRPAAGEQQRQQQTGQALGAAREALIGYALRYGRLPRPARSALDGTETPAPCDNASGCTGYLPWVTLGIDGADSWGKRIRYSVTPAYTVAPIQATLVGPDKLVVSRDSKGQPFYLIGQEGCPLYANCTPAVIFSSGKHNPGTSAQGILLPSQVDTNADERHNQSGANGFVSRAPSIEPGAPGGEFDDLVTWLPVQQLHTRMRAAGVLR